MKPYEKPGQTYLNAGRFRSQEKLRAKVQIALSNGGLLPVSDIAKPLVQATDEPGQIGNNPRWLTITS